MGLELENDENVNTFELGMVEIGSEGSGFHIKNNPKDPYQRSDVIQRTGAVIITCTIIDVVHGLMSADSDYWSTLIVFKFRFDPQGKARRLTEATIELSFDVTDAQNERPEVEAISFDDNYSLLPSTQSETIVKGADGSIGGSYGANLSVGTKWEKT